LKHFTITSSEETFHLDLNQAQTFFILSGVMLQLVFNTYYRIHLHHQEKPLEFTACMEDVFEGMQ
jgi:hypothetical protein